MAITDYSLIGFGLTNIAFLNQIYKVNTLTKYKLAVTFNWEVITRHFWITNKRISVMV